MIRKLALQILVPTLLAIIAWNGYLALSRLRETQKLAALILESSVTQTNISGVQRDLTDMETSQRGYLITGDDTYLQPYTDAKRKIEADFTELRVRLTKRSPHEQSLESQLESLAGSKQSEMERSINLRQRGYRHRAFARVATNEGKGYMDEIRQIMSSLQSIESGNFVKVDRERAAALKKAILITFVSNSGLFLLATCFFALTRRHARLLEKEASQSRRELALRDSQLTKLTSALSGEARSEIVAINTTSRLLLEHYGDFLPRQGHEYAQQMTEAAIQIERLRQDLVGSVGCGGGQAA
jgi:methyl-accepting chemotaxis protein